MFDVLGTVDEVGNAAQTEAGTDDQSPNTEHQISLRATDIGRPWGFFPMGMNERTV